MKAIIKLGLASLAIASLASCSTVQGFLGDSSSSSVAVQSGATKTEAPTAKISLKETKDNQVKAIIYTTYNGNPNGSVKLQWKAPKGTVCGSTSFPINKYGEKNDKTWATVKTVQGGKECKGTWTANVVYAGKVIATDSVTV